MKNIIYTFKLGNTKNNSNSTNNANAYTDAIKSTIYSNLTSKYPWFAAAANGNIDTDYYAPSNEIITNKVVSYTFTKKAPKKEMSIYDAIDILDAYAAKKYNHSSKDEYDFEIDGTPVRILGNLIQIGYHFFTREELADRKSVV